MIVDAHLHIWHASPGYPDPSITTVSPASEVAIDVFAEYMIEHGVDRGVLVQPLFPGEDNSYVVSCVRREPDRYAAVCYVDPLAAGAGSRLDYWAREGKCTGVRLRPPSPLDSGGSYLAAAQALCKRADELKLVVSVMASPEHLPLIALLVTESPQLALVIDHMAQPDLRGGVGSPAFRALLDLARFASVVVKVSGYYYCSHEAYPYRDCWDHFRAIYDSFGPDRMIWGSDFPHVLLKTGYRRALLLHERAFPFLASGDLERIMGGTALDLYWHER
jgi:L-fuconolactonase